MTMLVKEAFTYRFGNGKQLFVPVGAELEPANIDSLPGSYWVKPSTFRNEIDQHDAEYYGILVNSKNAISEEEFWA